MLTEAESIELGRAAAAGVHFHELLYGYVQEAKSGQEAINEDFAIKRQRNFEPTKLKVEIS